MRQHFILCGLGKVGWRVFEYLRAAGEAVVVIDDRCNPSDRRLAGVGVIVGDCRRTEILEEAGLAEARAVLVLTSDDLVSLSTALMVRHLHPNIRVVVRMFNQGLITRLGASVQNIHALSTSALAAPLLALIARTGEALGLVRLPSGASGQIVDFTITPQSSLAGRPLGALAAEHDFILVAHKPAGQPVRFIQEVDATASAGVHDRIFAFGEPAALARLLARSDNESLPELLWAGLVQRLARVFYRGLALVDLPVKICTVLFFATIVLSVLIFRFGMKDDSFVDAFYRTISLLATGADMHGEDAGAGTWQKAFISGLRVIGVALVAAFTAILTNYLIRVNLGGALDVRRIPESGHIIVCGLGNIGFRVVEELRAQGEQVVVIETNPVNPFIPTARRLGAAVLLGNASVGEVLRQAGVLTARAVVTATSSELLNLEIALLVREFAPRQRVVVRLTDPHLALTLRQAANVRLALAIPELAAPAFVASLYGSQLQSLFQVEGRVLTVYNLSVDADDFTLLGMTLQGLATGYGFLPVQHLGADGNPRPLRPESLLALGDRVTGIIALEHVHRLFEIDKEPATASS